MIMSKPKRTASKTREWERDRRDRLNVSFQALYRVLPSYDPAVVLSKIEILQKSAACIGSLKEQNKKLLTEGPEKENLKKKEFELLETRIDCFLKRIEQLTNLLRDAGIKIPVECGGVKHFKRPYLLSNKVTAEQADILAEKANKKENEEKKNNSKVRKNISTLNTSKTVLVQRNVTKKIRKINSQKKNKKLGNIKSVLQSQVANNKRSNVSKNSLVSQTTNRCTLLSNNILKLSAPQLPNVFQTQQSIIIQNTPVKRTNCVVTNSPFLSTPVMTTSIKSSNRPTDNLNSGMLIFMNGTVVPAVIPTAQNVIRPQPTILATVINNSRPPNQTVTLLPTADADKPDRVGKPANGSVQTVVLMPGSATLCPISNGIKPLSSNSFDTIASADDGKISQKSFAKIAPKLGITKTTMVNKLPIPALPPKFKMENRPPDAENKLKKRNSSPVKCSTSNENKKDSAKLTFKTKNHKSDKESSDTKCDDANRSNDVLNDGEDLKVAGEREKDKIKNVSKNNLSVNSDDKKSKESENDLKRKGTEFNEPANKKTKLDADSLPENKTCKVSESNSISKQSAVNNYSIDSLCKNSNPNKYNLSELTDFSINVDAVKKSAEDIPAAGCAAKDKPDVKKSNQPLESSSKANNLPVKKCSKNEMVKNSEFSTDFPKDSAVASTETDIFSKTCESLNIPVQHSELSNDIFASLQVPVGGQHPESISPTAAFLLAFPLVSTLNGGKISETAEEDNSDSQRGTPTLLQIGTFDTTKTSQVDNLNSNILSLDNFSNLFNKDLSANFYSCYENNLSNKQGNASKKITESNLSDNKFLDINNSNITYITSTKEKSSKMSNALQKPEDPLYPFNSLQTASTLASCVFSDMSLFRNSKISDNVFNYEHSSVLKDATKNVTEPSAPTFCPKINIGTDAQNRIPTSVVDSKPNCVNKYSLDSQNKLSTLDIKNAGAINAKTSTGKQMFTSIPDNVMFSQCQIENSNPKTSRPPLQTDNAQMPDYGVAQYNPSYNQFDPDFKQNSSNVPLPSNASYNYGAQHFPKYSTADNYDNRIFNSMHNKSDDSKCKVSKTNPVINYQQTTFSKPIYTTSQYGDKFEEPKYKDQSVPNQHYKNSKTVQSSSSDNKIDHKSNAQRAPVNWMTTPDVRPTQQINDFYIPPLNKDFDYGFATNTFQTTPQISGTGYYNNANGLYSSIETQNNSDARKSSVLDQPFNIVPPSAYSRNSTLLQSEDNQFSWSPTKIPFVDNHNFIIPSTLPTLLGDLALNPTNGIEKPTNRHCTFDNRARNRATVSEQQKDLNYAPKDSKTKYANKEPQIFGQSPCNNILSVSQLVDHNKPEPNIISNAAIRRSNANNSKGNGKHAKRMQKNVERPHDALKDASDRLGELKKDNKNMSSFNYATFAQCGRTENTQPFHQNRIDKLHCRNYKNLSKNYSAEALIGHNAPSDDMNHNPAKSNSCGVFQNQNIPTFERKNQSGPSFGPDISYFPSADAMPTQDSRYFSQSQTHIHQNLMTYSLANSAYQGNSSTVTNFMETENIDYNNQFMANVGSKFKPDSYPKTNQNKTDQSSDSFNNEKRNVHPDQSTDHKQGSGRRKQYSNDNNPVNFLDLGFLSIPPGIGSPLTTDDAYHNHASNFLASNSSQLFPNNAQTQIYPKTYNQSHGSGLRATSLTRSPTYPASLLPGSVNRPNVPAKEPHTMLSPIMGGGNTGTSVSNFNLSTIFPEINNAYKHKAGPGNNETCGHKSK